MMKPWLIEYVEDGKRCTTRWKWLDNARCMAQWQADRLRQPVRIYSCLPGSRVLTDTVYPATIAHR